MSEKNLTSTKIWKWIQVWSFWDFTFTLLQRKVGIYRKDPLGKTWGVMLCEMKGFDSFISRTQFLQAHQDPYQIISNPSIWSFCPFFTHTHIPFFVQLEFSSSQALVIVQLSHAPELQLIPFNECTFVEALRRVEDCSGSCSRSYGGVTGANFHLLNCHSLCYARIGWLRWVEYRLTTQLLCSYRLTCASSPPPAAYARISKGAPLSKVNHHN